MLTVLEAIKLSTDYLEKKGVESPRMNAELLLSDILNKKRLELYLSFDKPLDDDETVKYREYIARRGKFEPLQYITGKVEFYGLPFYVDSSVLIPRPETELLVEHLIEVVNKQSAKSILDIGTGSGNIAVTAAKFLNGVKITSIDVSGEAIATARKNAELNGVNGSIEFIHIDASEWEPGSGFDIIVSNPPYVAQKEYMTLQEEIVKYEPRNAVTDNSDGFTFYKVICGKAQKLLNENGSALFEIGQGQAGEIKNILSGNGFKNIRSINDYQGIERIIVGDK